MLFIMASIIVIELYEQLDCIHFHYIWSCDQPAVMMVIYALRLWPCYNGHKLTPPFYSSQIIAYNPYYQDNVCGTLTIQLKKHLKHHPVGALTT